MAPAGCVVPEEVFAPRPAAPFGPDAFRIEIEDI
jgi:hypothetical protein